MQAVLEFSLETEDSEADDALRSCIDHEEVTDALTYVKDDTYDYICDNVKLVTDDDKLKALVTAFVLVEVNAIDSVQEAGEIVSSDEIDQMILVAKADYGLLKSDEVSNES